jgi:inorganic pyrophosphatase
MGKSVNATHYDRLPAYPRDAKKQPHVVNAIIETPKGSRAKYDLVSEFGIIAFDHVLPEGLEWPYDYGFIPQTLAPDGDPLDLLLISENGLFSGCLIETRVIGVVRETKDGLENDRLLGVPLPSPGAPMPTDTYRDVSDIPRALLGEIKDFLVSYSRDQGHEIQIKAVRDWKAAVKSVGRHAKKFKKSNKS